TLMQAAAYGVESAQWDVFETSYKTAKTYTNAFMDVEVTVVFKQGETTWNVPAFWAGGDTWKVRFAPPAQGDYTYRVECTDKSNADLNGKEQPLRVTGYNGKNPLLKHGFVRATPGKGYFEHADGTPFLWLGDTWWKGLAKRPTWEGFQELTADRKAKGFSVVQIVCGPYPDEGAFEARWENEGGKPYETRDFSVTNPKYFDFADRRIKHLVDAGMIPAIVGAWGRGDCDAMGAVGVAGIKRHWRQLVARYGAYPVVWILAGEIGDGTKWGEGPWAEVATYLRGIDPYRHPLTCHTGNGRRGTPGDICLIDYDMVGGRHDGWNAATPAVLSVLTSACAKSPRMPVLCGETVYEGHMQQQNFQNVQRHIFWMYMLSGAAGHTYGAAGVWHASVEGHPGLANIYDWTTWQEGMAFPGATQIGLGKKLLEQYPWARFQPHPEWAEADCYAAGIPGEVRFIYQPVRNVYNWNGTVVKKLERDVPYHAFYFNPDNGKKFDLGTLISAGPPPKPFEGHTQPLLFADAFDTADASAWKDYGTPSRRKAGRLAGGKGLVTVLEKADGTNLMASAEARSDAEAGIILRFHDADNYLVAIYSPLLKAIFLHDRKNGQYGEALGLIAVPEIGPNIHLTAAACGEYAALVLTDGKKTYCTPTVKVRNLADGKAGLWLYQIGELQEYGRFELSRAEFGPMRRDAKTQSQQVIQYDDFTAPPLPSPRDWVLVLEREKEWKPYRDSKLNGKPIENLTINGRAYEVFEHRVNPEWGYKAPQQDNFILIHPKNDHKNAPLYVVLHSAGHDVLKAVTCTRDIGNHDVYRSPDDFYALYLDCRRNAGSDWWWGGMHRNDPVLTQRNSGGDPMPVERRLIDTVKWVTKEYGIDSNRVYLCGISMGGSGTLGIGMRNGDVFAAVRASIPAGIEHVSHRMYFLAPAIPDNVTFPDPPIVIDESAQNDGWSNGHERFVKAMNERKYALYLYWGPFGHADNHLLIEKGNDLVNSFDWLNVRRNEAYPVFANAASNNKPPWPDDLMSTVAGQVNAFFRWKCLSDTKNKLEMSLYLVTPAELKTTFEIPKETVADVSLRRIQKGPVKPGGAFKWAFGTANGEGKADVRGLITIPGLKITAEPTTLTVSK
ncbi:MAG: DUF4038 domain-containing protein, partial [bacterium]